LMLEAASAAGVTPAAGAIPEPSSAALVLAGIACVGFAVRRRFRSVGQPANR
jgi:PEP-CTERM motif